MDFTQKPQWRINIEKLLFEQWMKETKKEARHA